MPIEKGFQFINMNLLVCAYDLSAGEKNLRAYALRHTLHHQGQLAALAVWHGLEGGCWE